MKAERDASKNPSPLVTGSPIRSSTNCSFSLSARWRLNGTTSARTSAIAASVFARALA